MEALWYLRKQTIKNRVKKALKRPVTYIYLVLGIVYAVMVISGLGIILKELHFDSVYGLVVILTVGTFYMLPGNFVSYAGRKGIIFRPQQAHFVFTAPISPKLILLDGAALNSLLSFLFGLAISIAGIFVFGLPVWKAALLFIVGFGAEMVLEYSIILIVYGSDRFSDGRFKVWGRVIWGILLLTALFLVLYFRKNGMSLESAKVLIDHPGLCMIPVVGWNISAFRLILLGPDTVNVIGTILYLVTMAALALSARKMKNSGEYYEEAAKFADDYLEYRNKNKRGETTYSIGGKKKFRAVKGRFGAGAGAIFGRQLLEYKKERFFIFDTMTALCVVMSGIFGKTMDVPADGRQGLYLLGMLAYLAFCTSGVVGKWDKELQNPYLYLIPDTPVRKMWNATKMDHIKAVIDGTLMTVIVGIFWKIPTVQMICCIILYALLQANKTYLKVLAKLLLGNTMGKFGRDILRVLIQSIVLGIGVVIAVFAAMFLDTVFVFGILLVYASVSAAATAMLASMKFEVLEQTE